MTTPGASVVSSAGVKPRPIAGAIPSIGISEAVTVEMRTRSGGSLSPPIVTAPPDTSAISENARSERQSP
jgi:hypothetical protein